MIRLLCIALCLAGCAGGAPERHARTVFEPQPSTATAATTSTGARAAAVAYRQVGEPYRYGGSAPGGFDCSGLVHYAYQQVGLRTPRTTAQLWENTRGVERHRLRAGDILFFEIDGKPSHVGLYLGDGRFVHAPSSGKQVSVQTLDADFYQHAFIRGGRLAAFAD